MSLCDDVRLNDEGVTTNDGCYCDGDLDVVSHTMEVESCLESLLIQVQYLLAIPILPKR